MGISLGALFSVGLWVMGACSSDSTRAGGGWHNRRRWGNNQSRARGSGGRGPRGAQTARRGRMRMALSVLQRRRASRWARPGSGRCRLRRPGSAGRECGLLVLRAPPQGRDQARSARAFSTRVRLRLRSRDNQCSRGAGVRKVDSDAACNKTAPKDHCRATKAPIADDPCDADKLLVGKQQAGDECDTNGFDCAAGSSANMSMATKAFA